MTQRVAGLDVTAVAAYLDRQGLVESRDLRVSLISGGRSNLTYAIDVDDRRWVLRRPPLGEALATAHDMPREYTVIAALARTAVPVPPAVVLCRDTDVIGVPFYVMERVEGEALRTRGQVLALPPEQRTATVLQLVDILAELHMVTPEAVGLEDFGRPQGFMSRQVDRWTRQLVATRALTSEMTHLSTALAASVPDSTHDAVVHGDYRLDNCLVADGRIRAVLDWEMSTLGDPLGDLATFVVYHQGLADLPNTVVESPGSLAGVPPLTALLERYEERSGIGVGDLSWYLGFAWFKLAVILAGVDRRATQGQAAGQQFAGVDQLIDPCVLRGLTELERITL